MNTTATKPKKHRPGDLRKEVKRIEGSRDNLKEKCRGKSTTIKRLTGALDDTNNSRKIWRKKAEQKECEINELQLEIDLFILNEVKKDEEIAHLLEELKKKTGSGSG